jgi:hypothetical protein
MNPIPPLFLSLFFPISFALAAEPSATPVRAEDPPEASPYYLGITGGITAFNSPGGGVSIPFGLYAGRKLDDRWSLGVFALFTSFRSSRAIRSFEDGSFESG